MRNIISAENLRFISGLFSTDTMNVAEFHVKAHNAYIVCVSRKGGSYETMACII